MLQSERKKYNELWRHLPRLKKNAESIGNIVYRWQECGSKLRA
jgi:hypothetical protein